MCTFLDVIVRHLVSGSNTCFISNKFGKTASLDDYVRNSVWIIYNEKIAGVVMPKQNKRKTNKQQQQHTEKLT